MELQGVGKRLFISLRAFLHDIRKMDPFQGGISARLFLTKIGLISHSGKSHLASIKGKTACLLSVNFVVGVNTLIS